MSSCPPLILELVERFRLNQDHYFSASYNEEQLRHEFLNPMFQELGWDMANTQGKSDAYKDVLYEEALKPGAPDYTFRVGSQRKFFAEAKAPRVNIASEWQAALQIRSYARSAGLSLSILTNFAQFAVYDGRIPISSKIPKTSEALIFPIIPYTEYPTRWHEIESIFSNKSVWSGLFDRFAESKTDRRRALPIGVEFLDQISRWRKELAWHLRRDNPALSAPELNFAVQMTIDRIVFLRICEDRGIEPFGQLQRLLTINDVYGELRHIFSDADAKYNSGLFHFRKELGRNSQPDHTTLDLDFKDTVLKSIIEDLYESHFRFDVIPTEILGQVYEQFLGKVIVLKDKTAKVEDKPEVRKAGGVFYTPPYVVEFIVDNALGTLLENKTPGDVEKLTVLDPACGSGSFLLGAYQKLLDWHLDYYHHHSPAEFARQKNPPIRQIVTQNAPGLFEAQPAYRLTISERKRILLNNIFGVDIDAQAVEVTKLSLLLKCLEGETSESVQSLLKFMRQRALPDLDNNIKRGNSLIAPDFYDPTTFPEHQNLPGEEQTRINAFDWNVEFKPIIDAGGFDAIIGNPPYIPPELLDSKERAYFSSRHHELERKFDTSVVFILSMLPRLRRNGKLGYISSVTWQTGENYRRLRESIFGASGLEILVNLPFDVFRDAYVDTGVYVLVTPRPDSYGVYSFPKKAEIQSLKDVRFSRVPAALITPPDYKVILNPGACEILQSMKTRVAASPLGERTFSTQGLAGNRYTETAKAATPLHYNYLAKGQVQRYRLVVDATAYVSMRPFPSLLRFYGAAPKILIRRVINRQDRLLATYFDKPMVFKKDINPFVCVGGSEEAKFILGVINSKLISFIYVNISSIATKDDFRQTTLAELRALPIPSAPDDRKRKRLVQLVDTMLSLNQQLQKAKTGREPIERQISATDQHIDTLVYDLYQLTPDEIKLVEQSTS